MNWESLIDVDSLASLLPAEYSQFALPFKESLAVFLGRLPQDIQTQLLSDQLALAPNVSLSERLGRLAYSCPVLHKLGQILARDQRIAPQLRFELSKLESLPPNVSIGEIESILQQELGLSEFKTIEILSPAIAEASVAVIIPFRNKKESQQPEGVFKVLKPGINERLHLELDILTEVGSHLDERLHELGIPPIDYQDTFNQVRDKLRWELRLDEEQRHLVKAARFFSDQPDVVIPALFEQCTPRVTAMERVYGEKVTDHKFTTNAEKHRLAELVARALIVQPLFCSDESALFHCDPHAGNLFSTHDGKLAILDWSLAGFLGTLEREVMVQIMLATVNMQPHKIITTLLPLDTRGQCNLAVLTDCVARWMRKVRQGHIPGLSWLTGFLDDAVQRAGLRLSAELLMFRKSLLTLTGVLSEIGATRFDLDQLVLREFMFKSLLEWPDRWLSFPTSRSFATRLSNLDIAETIWGTPLIAGRFWQAMWRDSLERNAVCANAR